ncbi:hypothetical protein KUM39_09610 [Streptomyces sp. J2-1]|uniref:hypothetical protein n=1 Tax=Streptomyces corallincola TaxID=2851888 RepID=UPI001C38E16E|nr:hypothetical protein [Streptomyces corallincola]MBV2354615.1 hypothetical protein [Streptomyces corallincola]
MAFGAEELRVLRRALALALNPRRASAEDVKDCHRLARSLDEATREGERLRAFLVADLGRYRAALPGTAAGYLALLDEALGAGHRPTPDDLAALRALRGTPEAAALLARCRTLNEQDMRARLAQGARTVPAPAVPHSRSRLVGLRGGVTAGPADTGATPGSRPKPGSTPQPRPAEPPAPPKRPIPTPGEVFPRRKPADPPASRELAAG